MALPLLSVKERLGINQDIAQYNQDRLRLERLLAESSATHPHLIKFREELGERYRMLRHRVEGLCEAVRQEMELLDDRRMQREQELRAIATTEQGMAPLVRERRLKGTLYSYLSYKRSENDLLRSQVLSPIRIINGVQRGGQMSHPSWKLLLLALAGGLGLWLVWVLLPEFLDRRVRNARMVSRKVKVPVLAAVPEIAAETDELRRRDAFSGLAYQVMRELEGSAYGGGMLCVTSSTPGEGKTFLSVNLARSLAALGKRTCIVGLDLRRPVMQTLFGLKGTRGVSDFLSTPTEDDTLLTSLLWQEQEYENLTVLPAGTIPPNPAELLQTKRFGAMLAYLKERFDVVVLDTPPAEIVADTAVVSQYVDLSLYVVHAGYTDRRMLDAIDELYESGRLRAMRVVMNFNC